MPTSQSKLGARHAAALLLACATALLAQLGCGPGKLDVKACNAIRTRAFTVLNEAPTCATDRECIMSSWPGCRPAIQKMVDAIKPIRDEFDQGKCEEKAVECGKAEVWCNQGVCEAKTKPAQ